MKIWNLAFISLFCAALPAFAMGPCSQRGLLTTYTPKGYGNLAKIRITQYSIGGNANEFNANKIPDNKQIPMPNGGVFIGFEAAAADAGWQGWFQAYLPLDWDWAQHVARNVEVWKKDATLLNASVCLDPVSGFYLLEQVFVNVNK